MKEDIVLTGAATLDSYIHSQTVGVLDFRTGANNGCKLELYGKAAINEKGDVFRYWYWIVSALLIT